MKPNTTTETSFRNMQTGFGHGAHTPLNEWLHAVYGPESFSRRRYEKIAQRFLMQPTSFPVLELGAGVGDFSGLCRSLFPERRIITSDPSLLQLQRSARTVSEFFNISSNPKLLQCNAEQIPLQSNTVGLVFIKAAVHHFEHPQTAFSEIHRILVPGGRVVFFDDAVCLPFAWHRSSIERALAPEISLGINEHVYSKSEYLSFGNGYDHIEAFIDPALKELVTSPNTQVSSKIAIKRMISHIPILNDWFYILRFGCPFIFVFSK